MVKIWVIQHNRHETLGTISQALASAGLVMNFAHVFQGHPVPKTMDDAAGLIAMGGPMGVYDQAKYPFLLDEIQLMERALAAEKPILGVCLGSQLLATALGAPVSKGMTKEIGWHRVTLTAEGAMDPAWAGVEPSFKAFHWHGDVFGLPHGAASLAFSDFTQHQAFRYGNSAYGFLFHMEVTERIINGMVTGFADDLRAAQVDGRQIISRAPEYLPALHRIGGTVFRHWAELVKKGPR